jgi:hypothetical protein
VKEKQKTEILNLLASMFSHDGGGPI